LNAVLQAWIGEILNNAGKCTLYAICVPDFG